MRWNLHVRVVVWILFSGDVSCTVLTSTSFSVGVFWSLDIVLGGLVSVKNRASYHIYFRSISVRHAPETL